MPATIRIRTDLYHAECISQWFEVQTTKKVMSTSARGKISSYTVPNQTRVIWYGSTLRLALLKLSRASLKVETCTLSLNVQVSPPQPPGLLF